MAQVSVAQEPPPGAPPGGAPPAGALRPASKDPTAAPAGTYALDLEHHAVIVRAWHGGVSFNVLRFAAKQGSLVWDPSNPGRSKLEVTVDAKPITDPIVYRIKIDSEAMLDSAKFPEI